MAGEPPEAAGVVVLAAGRALVGAEEVATVSAIDLRLGDWRDVLADVGEVDAVIVDAPYSERTHSRHDAISEDLGRRTIDYRSWSPGDVDAFVDSWAPRCRGWMVSITDYELAPVWIDAMRKAGRYTFTPLPMVEIGSRVRLTGDGPSSWTCWVVVCRPATRAFASWGTLDGAYIGRGRGDRIVIGGKSTRLMRAIVRDYTRPGDLVCDPCAGGATTLLAAAIEGRRAVGAERDPETYARAMRRIEAGYTPTLDFGGAA